MYKSAYDTDYLAELQILIGMLMDGHITEEEYQRRKRKLKEDD